MEPLPPAYRRDATLISEAAVRYVSMQRNNLADMAANKEFVRQLRVFLLRWEGQQAVFSQWQKLEEFRDMLNGLESLTERLYIATVRELVEVRREWELAEAFVQLDTTLGKVVQAAPEVLRAGLEQAMRMPDGKVYDIVEGFRESMTDADKAEAAYRKLLREFEADWPERQTDPILLAIQAGDVESAISLIEEAAGKLAR